MKQIYYILICCFLIILGCNEDKAGDSLDYLPKIREGVFTEDVSQLRNTLRARLEADAVNFFMSSSQEGLNYSETIEIISYNPSLDWADSAGCYKVAKRVYANISQDEYKGNELKVNFAYDEGKIIEQSFDLDLFKEE